jgi:hypothetical protein
LLNPRCYAAALGGCSRQISAEHFFSRGVLAFLNDGPSFSISGFPWQGFSNIPQPSIASLGARILCTKHNSALHPLDDECLKLFKFFQEVDRALATTAVTGRLLFDISGDALERWMLKALVGLVASGNAAKDNQPLLKSPPPLACLQLLYGREAMPPGWGLYLAYELGERVMATRGMAFAPLIDRGRVLGAVCQIHGFRFLLAMAVPEADRKGSLLETAVHRPAYLSFSHSVRPSSVRLNITWNTSEPSHGLEITYYDEEPK